MDTIYHASIVAQAALSDELKHDHFPKRFARIDIDFDNLLFASGSQLNPVSPHRHLGVSVGGGSQMPPSRAGAARRKPFLGTVDEVYLRVGRTRSNLHNGPLPRTPSGFCQKAAVALAGDSETGAALGAFGALSGRRSSTIGRSMGAGASRTVSTEAFLPDRSSASPGHGSLHIPQRLRLSLNVFQNGARWSCRSCALKYKWATVRRDEPHCP